MGNCKYCRANCAAAKIDREVFCLGYDPAKTHGDRVRNMNDEELANVMARSCPRTKDDCGKYYIDEWNKPRCNACWLDWLREEAET